MPQVAVDEHPALGIDLHRLQPLQALGLEEPLAVDLDQPHGQHAVDAVPHHRPLADQRAAAAGQLAEPAGGLVGLPDLRQEVATEKLGQHVGIDLIGLDLGLGDGLGGQGIGDHQLGHVRPQDVGHSPAVGRGFEGHVVRGLEDLGGEEFQRAAVQGEAFAVDHRAGGIDDAGLDHALVDIEAHVTYHYTSHGSFSCDAARPVGNPLGFAAKRWQKLGPRVRFSPSAEVGPKRQLPLRARSSTGWAGRVLRYDGGLEAHSHSRAAPKCPGLPVLLVLGCGWKDVMVSLRRHFVPNPVQVNYCNRRLAKRRRPLFIHTRYDAAGNMTTMPQPGNEATGLTCVYDAWNRLVEVENGSTVLATYS